MLLGQTNFRDKLCLALLTGKLSQPSELKKISGTRIIARFSDNSDSTILRCLKFLTKLLGHAIPYSAAIIEVWLDKLVRPLYILIAVCIETNGLTRLRAPKPEDTFF